MQNLSVMPKYFSYSNSNMNCSLRTNDILFKGNSKFINEISDLKQYNLPVVGEYFCGPVSAANAVINLVKQDISQLNNSKSSSALINELAQYFKTDKNGTTTSNMCLGLESFIKAKGLNPEIKYQGFRQVDQKYKVGLIPDLEWIKAEMDKGNEVLLNLGVYKKTVENGKNIYKRQYGHFVNASGKNSNGLNEDANYLAIHDPYDKVNGNHYIKVDKINDGKFIHNQDDNEVSLADDARGFLEIPTRFNYFASDEVAVINGVVSLGIKR